MTNKANFVELRFKLSGLLLIFGLLTEAICLFWARPLSFLLMIGFGGLFVTSGVVVYLLSLVSKSNSSDESNP